MKANRVQIEQALAKPGADIRLYLLHGPDRSSSAALAARLATAMGTEAERVDLGVSELKSDPARLADEAAAISMFGDARFIRIDPAGEEMLAAVEALLEAGEAGNPVVAVAGDLKPAGKLLKLAQANAAVMTFASYPSDARDARRLAMELGQGAGLRLSPDQAHRLAGASGGDRAILTSEIGKLALYADAAPERPREATHAMIDAIGAASDEGAIGDAVNLALDGDAAALDGELARLSGAGADASSILRALLRRLALLARLRAEVERGNSAASVVGKAGYAIFWKERDRTISQLQFWRGDMLARAISRALGLLSSAGGSERAIVGEELFALARAARRRR